MEYYSTSNLAPELQPSLMRRTDDGALEAYQYASGSWQLADRDLESRFRFTGDWDPCSEEHMLEAIALYPPGTFGTRG